MDRELRFVSSNQYKIRETQDILANASVRIVAVDRKIEELQTVDTSSLVRDKALKAFALVGRPLFVEHTGLYLNYLNGFPGGLTQIFWDTLGPDRFTEAFGKASERRVVAKTIIGYIDSQRFHEFSGEAHGEIAEEPRGPRHFQWDCVFIPAGQDQTFAEMGPAKNEISMRRRALEAFGRHLRGGQS